MPARKGKLQYSNMQIFEDIEGLDIHFLVEAVCCCAVDNDFAFRQSSLRHNCI